VNTNVLEVHLILIFSTEVKVGMWVVYAGKRGDQTEDNEDWPSTVTEWGAADRTVSGFV
jgi:hypothetical protein